MEQKSLPNPPYLFDLEVTAAARERNLPLLDNYPSQTLDLEPTLE